MPVNQYGWCGKILRVDLSTSEISELDTMKYADRFLGGRGIATCIYWESVMPETGALDPGNHLIFMTGPLGATGAQGASRFIAVGKSPMRMPEGFCYGNMGGFFGPYLKRAGYDGLIITGKSEKKVYLYIQDNKTSILSADNLWGKGVYQVRDAIKEIHGKNVRFITTGPAGENLCRSANIMTDNEGSATGGFGAVFGSKNLKAIAVTGSGSPLAADPERLKELNQETIYLNKKEPVYLPFNPEQVKRTGKSSCYQCGLDCMYRNAMKTASGKDMVRKCQSMFVYFPWTARTGESAETALNATGICNDLSLCTMEMYNIVHWISAGFQSGYLNHEQTGLDISKLGKIEFFETLANMIAHRQGFGDILANGLLRAGEILGDQAKELFSPEVSGVGDGATYSAREYMMNGLLYAFEPRQPIAMLHEISRLTGLWVMNQADPKSSPVTNDVFRGAAAKFWGHEKAWDLMTHEGKAHAAVKIMNRTYFKDSLLLCDSCWPLMVSWNTPDYTGYPDLESRTFSAVTGIEMDEAGLHKYGERIFNLERAILLREGRKPKTDDIIAEFNYTQPVQTVFMNPEVIIPGPGNQVLSRRGCTIEPKIFEQMRKEFYELRGWDTDTGIQKKETLERLDLCDLL
ncbi:Tungsten-containing aldehyde:ferredoxin oxidoreductase [Desulfonema limicola]|uniref:Tungsten-containing aldehyde:ferredoxin oxidoreductase n=1 Tax=Desulfonema limicola TaxID=45656 RepID=A0A975BA09_9BACT|nr:aldehyde ferredoxin oxidoreductase N-terminal domain-containing protein [Desulfonema limicola]QTA81563.1 Tungsten-containing aldehyde:ferredoxin oxidoreductase [Desulfonema limicola]